MEDRPDTGPADLEHIWKLEPKALAVLVETRDWDWQHRDTALQRLGAVVAADGLDVQSEDFKTILLGVAAQLSDLRSQIVRSACNTLTAIVEAVGDHQVLERPMREVILPALLTLAGNGNKVLAAAGRECLPLVLNHCHFDSMIKVLVLALKESKQNPVRHLCCVCLSSVIENWPLQVKYGQPGRAMLANGRVGGTGSGG